jgi:hypothetical protein
MLSLNTASKTCRLGLKLHGPKIRQVATFDKGSPIRAT